MHLIVLACGLAPRALRRWLLLWVILSVSADGGYGQGTVIFNPPGVVVPPPRNTNFVVIWPPLPPAPVLSTNDLFANASPLAGSSISVSGNLSDGSSEAGEPRHYDRPAKTSVWWRWTAPTTGMVDVYAGTLRLGIYTGSSLSNLTSVPFIHRPPTNTISLGVPSSVKYRFLASAGSTYHIAVDTWSTGLILPSWQPFTLTLELGRLDLIAPAIRTELDFGEPIRLEFAPFDSADILVSAEAVAGSNSLGTVTMHPFAFTYQPTHPGIIYIRATGTNAQGEQLVSLGEWLTIGPPNDDFTNAFVIPSELVQGVFEAENQGATLEFGEPTHYAGGSARRSSWWKWQPRFPGQATFAITSGNADLAVYKGEALTSLERLGSVRRGSLSVRQWEGPTRSWDAPVIGVPTYEVKLNAEPGTTYWIALDATSASWAFSRRTLELHSSVAGNRERTGAPIQLEARHYESSGFPGPVEFVIGQASWRGFLSTITEVAVLGRVTTPPYLFSWVPQSPGPWYVWARATNSAGQWRVSQSLLHHVIPANDDAAHATVIRRGARSERLPILHLSAASFEGEEPLQDRPVMHGTLWWKWRPSYSGPVRFKAVQSNCPGSPGILSACWLELDVFKGSGLGALRLVGSNSGRKNLGQNGVHLDAQAGKTYFVRVVNFRDPPGDDAVLLLEPDPSAANPPVHPSAHQTFQPHVSQGHQNGFNAVYRRASTVAWPSRSRSVFASVMRAQGWTRCWACAQGCHAGRCARTSHEHSLARVDCRWRCSHGHALTSRGTATTLRRCRCTARFQPTPG